MCKSARGVGGLVCYFMGYGREELVDWCATSWGMDEKSWWTGVLLHMEYGREGCATSWGTGEKSWWTGVLLHGVRTRRVGGLVCYFMGYGREELVDWCATSHGVWTRRVCYLMGYGRGGLVDWCATSWGTDEGGWWTGVLLHGVWTRRVGGLVCYFTIWMKIVLGSSNTSAPPVRASTHLFLLGVITRLVKLYRRLDGDFRG